MSISGDWAKSPVAAARKTIESAERIVSLLDTTSARAPPNVSSMEIETTLGLFDPRKEGEYTLFGGSTPRPFPFGNQGQDRREFQRYSRPSALLRAGPEDSLWIRSRGP